MITWEPTHDGYLECFVGSVYGVVGLAHERTGWMARLERHGVQLTAPAPFHTAHEAKQWVEAQIEALGGDAHSDQRFGGSGRDAAPSVSRWGSMLTVLRPLIETFGCWSAALVDRLGLGGQPTLCYAPVPLPARGVPRRLDRGRR